MDFIFGESPSAGQFELPQVLVAAFEVLQAGVSDRRAAFHTPLFASSGLDGRPLARIVVLRGFDPEQRCLRFHTDFRSGKVAQITRDARVAFTFYDPAMKLQIRCEGVASCHHKDAIAENAWAGSQMMSKICYGTSPASGAVIAEADAFTLPAEPADIQAGQENFCAVLTTIESLEWLWLGHGGHRRARFTWGENGQSNGVWLVP